jgi:hypothetical protein
MKFSNLVSVFALGLLSFNSVSFADTNETLVKCSAKVTSSTNEAFAQVGSLMPLDIELTHVDAASSSDGKPYDNMSFQLGSGDTFLAGGKLGDSASMSSDSLTLDKSSYFDDGTGDSHEETFNFDRQNRTLIATYSKLFSFEPKVVVNARCQ